MIISMQCKKFNSLLTLCTCFECVSTESAGMPGLAGDTFLCCTVRLKGSRVVRELTSMDDMKKEFTSRCSLEWKFLFLDHRLQYSQHLYAL